MIEIDDVIHLNIQHLSSTISPNHVSICILLSLDFNATICEDETAYSYFWNYFYVLAGVGGVSTILLGCMILHYYMNRKREPYHQVGKSSEHLTREKDIDRFWVTVLTIAWLNMLVTFVTMSDMVH
jgi:hypothetical protein